MQIRNISALLLTVLSIVRAASAGPPLEVEVVQRTDAIAFDKEILPILRKNCLACHSASEKQGELVLESPQGILKGGDNGPAVVPGKGADSLLMKMASHQTEPVMPPEGNDVAAGNLTALELGLLQVWIDQGARGTGGIDSMSPKQMRSLPRGLRAVQAVTLTEDGQYVAFGRSGQILMHHVPTGQLLTELVDPSLATTSGGAHRDLVQSLAFNVDGDLLASGGFREVKLWRRPRDVQKLNIAVSVPAATMAISPDRKWIAANGPNNTVQLFSVADGAAGLTFTGHTDTVTSARFTSDGLKVVSGSLDQSICVWNIYDGTLAGRIETPTPISTVELVNVENPTDAIPSPVEWIASGGGDNMLRLWQMPKSGPIKLASSPADAERTFSSRDRRLLGITDHAGTVKIIALSSAAVPVAEHEIAVFKIEGGVTSLDFIRKVDSPEPTIDNMRDCYNVLMGTPNGSVLLWSLSDQALLDTWQGSFDAVRAVAGSTDGTTAVSGGEDGGGTVWDVRAAPSISMDAASGEQFALTVLSPSRMQIASVGVKDGQPAIIVRSCETGRINYSLIGHAGNVLSVAFSPDDARLISGGDDGTIRIWDLGNAGVPELKRIDGLTANVTAVGTNNDASQLIAGFSDNTLRLFNIADGMLLKEFSGHTGVVSAVGFWNNQPFSVSQDASVRFWNAADGTQVRAFSLPSPPTSFTLSADTQRMGFAGADHQVRICQTDNGSVLQTLQGFAAVTTSLSFSPDAQLLCSVSTDGRVSVFNSATGRLQESFVDPAVRFAAFTRSPASLLVARANAVITAHLLRFLHHLDGNTQPVRAMAFHPNNQLMYVAAADGSLRGYSRQNGQATFTTSHGAVVNDLAVSDDGQFLATAGDNHVVRLWNASGGGAGPQQLTGFSGPVHRVAFSDDGKLILATSSGEKPAALVHDMQTGVLLQSFSGHAGDAVGCAILPVIPDAESYHTQIIALTASAAGVYQWNVTALRQIPGHTGPVTSLARIPGNPRQLFSGSADSTIRRWNLESGQQMQQYNHGGAVASIAVSPDVERIASASNNHTAKLFRMNGQQIAEMRGDIRRRIKLTRAQQYEAASNTRLNVAKQLADAAEKDLPLKTEAEKKLTEMLATADIEVQTRGTAVDTALTEKTTSEKAAIEASTAARAALAAKQVAEQSAKAAAAEVVVAQAKLGRLQQAASSEPQNEGLKAKITVAQAEIEAATQRAAAMTAAVQAPADNAAAMSALANEMAQKLTTVQKPYNDAVVALKAAESDRNLLSQQQVLAARELTVAQELVPIRKDAIVRSESNMTEAKAAVAAASTELQESELALRSVAFSPDGSTLATSGDFPGVHTWDAHTGTAIGAFVGHTAPVNAIAFVDDRTLASASDDQFLCLWDVNPDWILERTLGSFDDPNMIAHRVTSVDFNADSSQLLIASGIPSRRGELQIFNVADESRILYQPQAHDDVIYAARFSPDGKRIASGGADKYLRTFDVATGQQLRRFEGHTSYVLGVAWKRDGRMIATSGADNTVKIWDSETGDQQRTIEDFGRHVTAVSYIGETDAVISACGDRIVRMHNASNGGVFRNISGPNTWLHAVAITPDSNIVAAGDANGNVYLWNGTNGQLLKVLEVETP